MTPDVWDVDAQGVPHDLGVLGPLRRGALVPRRQPADAGSGGRAHRRTFGGQLPDLAVAERQQYLTIADARLPQRGRQARATPVRRRRTTALGASTFGGIYYGLDGAPEEECVVTADPFSRLPAAGRRLHPVLDGRVRPHAGRRRAASTGTADAARRLRGALRRAGDGRQPDRRGGRVRRRRATCCRSTEFPQFESWGAAEYADASGRIVAVEGEWAAAATHVDDGYQRLGRTFDLTGV